MKYSVSNIRTELRIIENLVFKKYILNISCFRTSTTGMSEENRRKTGHSQTTA